MCDSGLHAGPPGVSFRGMYPQLQGMLAAEQRWLSAEQEGRDSHQIIPSWSSPGKAASDGWPAQNLKTWPHDLPGSLRASTGPGLPGVSCSCPRPHHLSSVYLFLLPAFFPYCVHYYRFKTYLTCLRNLCNLSVFHSIHNEHFR